MRGAVVRVDARGSQSELVELELAEDDRAGLLEPFRYGGVLLRHELSENLRADGGGHSRDIVQVLQPYGDSVQGAWLLAGGQRLLGACGRSHSLIAEEGDEGIEPPVGLLDSPQMGVDELHRGEVPGRDEPGGLCDREEDRIVVLQVSPRGRP